MRVEDLFPNDSVSKFPTDLAGGDLWLIWGSWMRLDGKLRHLGLQLLEGTFFVHMASLSYGLQNTMKDFLIQQGVLGGNDIFKQKSFCFVYLSAMAGLAAPKATKNHFAPKDTLNEDRSRYQSHQGSNLLFVSCKNYFDFRRLRRWVPKVPLCFTRISSTKRY